MHSLRRYVHTLLEVFFICKFDFVSTATRHPGSAASQENQKDEINTAAAADNGLAGLVACASERLRLQACNNIMLLSFRLRVPICKSFLSLLSFSYTPSEYWPLGLRTQVPLAQPICPSIVELSVHTKCKRIMHSPVFQISHSDDVDIACAKKQLKGRVPADLVPYLLLLLGIPEDYRESLIEAAQRVSGVREDLRLQYLSRVSAWKGRRGDYGSGSYSKMATDPRGSFPLSEDALSSCLSATSATSASSGSLFSSSDNLRKPDGARGSQYRANGIAFNDSANLVSRSPHTISGSSFAPNASRLFAAAGHRAIAPLPGAVIQPAYPISCTEQQSSSNHTFNEILSEFPHPGDTAKVASNPGRKEPAKWLCPVCGIGCTRATQMKMHVKSQCLFPTSYVCLGCSFKSRSLRDIEKHRKNPGKCSDLGYQEITPPARSKYASCLTGKIFDTDTELIGDADEYCRGSQDIQESSQTVRLRALLGENNIKDLNEEIEQQCSAFTGNAKLWQELHWLDDNHAKNLSGMAEFGLQVAKHPTRCDGMEKFIGIPGYDLEQHNLGIANLREYATEVLRRSHLGHKFHELPHSSNHQHALLGTSAAQRAAQAPAENAPVNPGDSAALDFHVQYSNDWQPDLQFQQDCPDEHSPDQGQNFYQRPVSAIMQDYDLAPQAQWYTDIENDTFNPSEDYGVAL